MSAEAIVTFLARLSLVLLFLPFSAFDKIVNFDLAKQQAQTLVDSAAFAKALIVAGLFVEVVMSLGVLTGIADRLAAFVLAGYCIVTALLWKRFWQQPDFKLVGKSRSREVFWDFLKNFALAGGFLMVTLGPNAGSARRFLEAPFASTHPYSLSSARTAP